MSNFNDSGFDSRPSSAMRPGDYLHNSSEPLPGAAGSRPTTDYETRETMNSNRSRLVGQAQDQLGEYGSGTPEISTSHDRPVQVGHGDQGRRWDRTAQDASDSGIDRVQMDRPLGVQPAREGGVVIGGRENQELPMGKANMGDKVIGKTQKVMGKMTRNLDMHEKGELREAGGKSAATGSARAPHD